MVETVLILPFIMIVIVLLIYLGWNFRRLALVTNMDRYVVWSEVTPGAPGPRPQEFDNLQMRNPHLDAAFFGLNNDGGQRLDELRSGTAYLPQAHQDLLQQQADETYSYFSAFLGSNYAGVRERMTAQHSHITDSLEQMGMEKEMTNRYGHRRLHGDWRFANGVRNGGSVRGWVPDDGLRDDDLTTDYRTLPGTALVDVFFAQIDDVLGGYSNEIAAASRDLYRAYPGYDGPIVYGETYDD